VPAPAVATTGLTKRYRDVVAVDAVALRVEPGEIYAFLGRNGAGKTTTIRMLLGMVRPTAGHAQLLGVPVAADATALWRRVGHLVEAPSAWPELSVRENLELARRLHGVADAGTVDRAIGRLGLAAQSERRAGTLSLGNLQRLALARALLPEPELLLLDEPANGLDPAGVVEIRALLQTLARERGTTVFVCSHQLSEVERIATRVGVIHNGRLLAELDAEELELRRRRRLELRARDLERAEAILRAVGLRPARVDGAGEDARLELHEPEALAAPDTLARRLVEGGEAPTHLAIVQEDLEAWFLRLTATGERGAE
jgi:ABC-2 type transport system ATP-binding protein